jgi:hypothetical protein
MRGRPIAPGLFAEEAEGSNYNIVRSALLEARNEFTAMSSATAYCCAEPVGCYGSTAGRAAGVGSAGSGGEGWISVLDASRRLVFNALRRRVLIALPPGLDRRRIVFPEAQDKAS